MSNLHRFSGSYSFPLSRNDAVPWNHVLVTSGIEQAQSVLGEYHPVLLQPPHHMVKSQETGGTRREEDQNNVVSGNDNQPDLSEQENQTNDVAMEPVTKKSKNRPKRHRTTWSESSMNEAVLAILSRTHSVRAASSKYNIPRSSLHDRVKKTKAIGEFSGNSIAIPEQNRSPMGAVEDSPSFCRVTENGWPEKSEVATEGTENSMSSSSETNGVFEASNNDWNSGKRRGRKGESANLSIVRPRMTTPLFSALGDASHSKNNKSQTEGKGEVIKKKTISRSTSWSRRDLEQAIAAVKEHGLSIRKAALFYRIPKSTLSDWLTGKRKLKDRVIHEEETACGRSNAEPCKEQIKLNATDEMQTRSGKFGIMDFHQKLNKISSGTNQKRRKRRALRSKAKEISNIKLGSPTKRNLASDEVQVHILDDDIMGIDEDLNGDFIINENEEFEPICRDERFSGNKGAEYNFVDTGQISCGDEEKNSDDEAESEDHFISKERTLDLQGRITMTCNVIDRADNASSKSWTQNDMECAIRDVIVNGLSIRKAADRYRIPKSSLADRITRQKCSRAFSRLSETLRPLAKSRDELKALKKLENGRITLKGVANRFGMSFSHLHSLMNDGKNEGCLAESGEANNAPTQDLIDSNGCSASQLERRNKECGELLLRPIVNAKHMETKSKRERMCWSFDNLELAIAAVRERRLSLRGSSKMYGIPKSTLGDILRGKSSVGSNPSAKRLLTDGEEASIARWLMRMAKTGQHVKVKQILLVVKEILDKSGKQVPRLHDNLPTESWWHGFLARHKEVAELRKQSRLTPKGTDNVEELEYSHLN